MSSCSSNLTQDQFDYVLACYAFDLELVEIVSYFCEMFPDFVAKSDYDEKTLRVRLYERFKKIKSRHAEKIEQLRDPSQIPSEHPIPIANSHYRLRCLYQIWHQTPARSLLRKCKDDDGDVYEVHRSNARDRVAILAHAVVELRYMDERGLGNLGGTTEATSGPAQGEFGDVVEGGESDGEVEHSHQTETATA